MNKTIRTPTLAEIKAAGYTYEIRHFRHYDVAYKDRYNRLAMTTMLEPINPSRIWGDVITNAKPKGGRTRVTVFDETGREWTADAKCRDDDGYNKKDGINRCLDRIVGLMLVLDGTEDFRCRLQC